MQQTVMPSEILVADDGSGPSTRAVIEHFASISPVPLRHIWHEDKGFRLAAIRNKAIAASRSEYIIQIDGDLILHRKFVQDHLAFARKGRFITGSRGVLTEELTHRLLDGESVTLTLLAKGVRNKNNALRLPLLAALYGAVGPTRFVKGCNMAFWRDDLIRVNGYDETFTGWGREDTELAIRLNNIGIRQQSMKYQGIVFHLHHKQQDRDNLSANDAHYQQSVREHRTRCEKGVDQHFGPTGQ